MGTQERRRREETARLDGILEAASAVFAERGYFATRMEDIADRAELSKGAVYYYFDGKDAIYARLLERESRKIHAELLARIAGKETLLELIEEGVEFFLEYFSAHLGFLRMFLPLMGGFVRLDATARPGTDDEARQWAGVREAFRARMAREALPFGPDELLRFFKTLQIGMGLKLLEGQADEARAAGRFFVRMMKRVLEDKS